MGAICLALASCKKPEGDDLDDLVLSNDTVGMLHLGAVGNVDYADFTISNALAKKVQIEKLELHWFEKPLDSLVPDTPEVPVDSTGTGDTVGVRASYQDVIRLLIENPTTLEVGWEKHYRLFGLKPGTSYCYFLVVEDLLGRKTSDTLEFATKTIADATMFTRVTADSVRLVESQPCFYGSVNTHWRALEESVMNPDSTFTDGFVLGFQYGLTADTLDQVLTNYVIDYPASGFISEPAEGDMVFCVFHCAAPVMDSCWYRAYVRDSWGNEFVSDTILQYSTEAPKAVWWKDPQVGGSTQVTLYGNSSYKGGDDMSMKKRGFCWAKHPNVTLSDSVWYDPEQPLEWLKRYEYHLTGLDPATNYYCRVFLVLDGADSTTRYSEEKMFTTLSPVELTMRDPSNITAHTADLTAVVGATDLQVEERTFLWRKINGPTDTGVLTFANAGENVMGGQPHDDGTFTATLVGLEEKQEYVVGAYIKLKNGEERFSNTKRFTPEEE
ncbi:MAG: hypothetical protein J6X40_02755 [Bacteroidales bacterium]|nr:hypothetical protein [Bacteroidales bacterium]